MNGSEFLPAIDAAGFKLIAGFLSIIWQTSIILAAAMVLDWTLRNRSAAARHAVWASAVLAVPVIPLLTWLSSEAGTPRAAIPVIPVHTEVPVSQPIEPVSINIDHSDAAAKSTPFVMDQQYPIRMESLIPAATSTPVHPAGRKLSFWILSCCGYCVITGIFLLYICMGRLYIRRLMLRGRISDNERVATVFREAASALDFRGKYRIIESTGIETPLTTGIFHSTVIMPERLAAVLSDGELRSLALHELSHMKRRDPLVLTLVSLVRAVFFVNPLVWLGARRTAQLAEVACDDAVVSTSGEPLGYARMLARIAESLSSRALGTELAAGFVVSKGSFLRRIETILSGNVRRFRRLSRRAQAAIICAGILSLGTAVALPLVEADASGKDTLTVKGSVTYRGKPVANADIWLVSFRQQGEMSVYERKSRTGGDGKFTFKITKTDRGELHASKTVMAVHGNYSMGWKLIPVDSTPVPLAITLTEPHTVSGTILDTEGKPIRDAEVWVRMLSKRINLFIFTNDIIGFEPAFQPLVVRTDEHGTFTLGHIPIDSMVSVAARKRGFAWNSTPGVPPDANMVSLTLKRGNIIEGTVLLADTRKAVPGVVVRANSFDSTKGDQNGSYGTAVTDINGRFMIDNLAPGVYRLFAFPGTRYPDRAVSIRDSVTVTPGDTIRNIEIALVTGSLVTGRITDGKTGAPLKGAHIAITPGSTTETDDNGVYRMRICPGPITISVSAPWSYIGYKGNSLQENNEIKTGETLTCDYTFDKGSDVRIIARTDDGKPVSGAVYGTGYSYIGGEKSDSNGVILLQGFQDGQKIQLTVNQYDMKLRGSAEVEVKPNASYDVILTPYETMEITGRVIDDNGKPAGGTAIWLMRWDKINRTGLSTQVTSTDRYGGFRIAGLIVGDEYQVQIRDGQARTETFTARKDFPPIELRLLKAEEWLEGTVIYSDGKPAPGVRIIVNGGPSGYKETTTDMKGWYRLDKLIAGSEEISIEAGDRGWYRFKFIVTGLKHDFVLPVGQRVLAGTITDPSGKPMPGVNLTIDENGAVSRAINIRTDVKGKFRFESLRDAAVAINASWIPNTSDMRGYRSKQFTNLTTNRTDVVLVFDNLPDDQNGTVMRKDVPPPIGGSLAAPRKAGTFLITVDGNLSDWAQVNIVPAKITRPDPEIMQRSGWTASPTEKDVSAEFRCCADRDFVYFAVSVTDDTLRFGESRFEAPYKDDSVEFQIFGDTKPVYAGQICVGAERDGTVKLEGRDPVANEKFPFLWAALGVRAALKQRAGGYDVETAVPWSVLAWSGWGKGRLMGVNVYVYDRDAVMNTYIEWAANPGEKYGIIAFNDAPGENEIGRLYQAPDAARIRTILEQVKATKWDEALDGIKLAGDAPWCAPMRAVVLGKTQNNQEESIRAFIGIARKASSPSVAWWATDAALWKTRSLDRGGKNTVIESLYDEIAALPAPPGFGEFIRFEQAKCVFNNGKYDKAKMIAENIVRDAKPESQRPEMSIASQARELIRAIAQIQAGNR